MQSDLEREMSRQLSLMQHKAVDPWPAFQTELHFDWCCEHPKRNHHPCEWLKDEVPHCSSCHIWEPSSAFHAYRHGRNWRADFAYPGHNLLIEVDGAVYTAGRHTRGKGYTEDARKQARAVELGWRVVHFTGEQVKSGEARNAIGRILFPDGVK